MSKEIICRGKRLDNGKWVEGVPWIFSKPMNEAVIVYGMGTCGEDDGVSRYCEAYPVDPNTIGEYTGFKDKNGTRVFDGDIIQFGDGRYVVWWNDESFQWQARVSDIMEGEPIITLNSYPYPYKDVWNNIDFGWIGAESVCIGSTSTEVVGNIYDNPEFTEANHAKDPCAFCESLETKKEIHQQINKNREGPKYLTEYSVALVERSWYKGMSKRNSGRTTDYRYRGCGYKLNFCPECGKKV